MFYADTEGRIVDLGWKLCPRNVTHLQLGICT